MLVNDVGVSQTTLEEVFMIVTGKKIKKERALLHNINDLTKTKKPQEYVSTPEWTEERKKEIFDEIFE